VNFTISSIFIILLLLPGLAFRRFYYTEEFSKQYFKQSFFSIFISSFLPSFILHSIWIYVITLFGYRVDFVIIGNLLQADYSPFAYKNIDENTFEIISYNATLILASSILGYASKQLVRRLKLDRKFKMFRFQNYWHYIFKGEFFDFPRASFDLYSDSVIDIEFVYIDVLVETGEGTLIYDGILVDYELSKDGGLETIMLKEVERRFLKDDPQQSSQGNNTNSYYDIPGHVLSISNSEILNINFSYYKLIQTGDSYGVQLVQ